MQTENEDIQQGQFKVNTYQKPCAFFNTPRGCRNGNKCQFAHIKDSKRPKCRFFSQTGNLMKWFNCQGYCKFGNKCFYEHDRSNIKHFKKGIKTNGRKFYKQKVEQPSKEEQDNKEYENWEKRNLADFEAFMTSENGTVDFNQEESDNDDQLF